MEKNKRYERFVEQFAVAFNSVLDRMTKDLNNEDVNIDKHALLNDLFNSVIREANEEHKEDCEVSDIELIEPTVNMDELPKEALDNLIYDVEHRNQRYPLYVKEIIRIFMDDGYYAVEVRTLASNFITTRYKYEDFKEIINRKKTEENNVFKRSRCYSVTIK